MSRRPPPPPKYPCDPKIMGLAKNTDINTSIHDAFNPFRLCGLDDYKNPEQLQSVYIIIETLLKNTMQGLKTTFEGNDEAKQENKKNQVKYIIDILRFYGNNFKPNEKINKVLETWRDDNGDNILMYIVCCDELFWVPEIKLRFVRTISEKLQRDAKKKVFQFVDNDGNDVSVCTEDFLEENRWRIKSEKLPTIESREWSKGLYKEYEILNNYIKGELVLLKNQSIVEKAFAVNDEIDDEIDDKSDTTDNASMMSDLSSPPDTSRSVSSDTSSSNSSLMSSLQSSVTPPQSSTSSLQSSSSHETNAKSSRVAPETLDITKNPINLKNTIKPKPVFRPSSNKIASFGGRRKQNQKKTKKNKRRVSTRRRARR